MIHFRILLDYAPICWITNRPESAETTTEIKEVTCPECKKILEI